MLNITIPGLKHIAAFVDEMYADILEVAGFISRDNQRVHWYRIHGETFQSILFCASHFKGVPMFLCYRAEVTPFFAAPLYPNTLKDNQYLTELSGPSPLRDDWASEEEYNYCRFSEGNPIMYPNWGTGGRQKIAETVERMSQIVTVHDCVAYHKAYCQRALMRKDEPWETFLAERSGTGLMAELIWVDDNNSYDACRKRLHTILDATGSNQQKLSRSQKARMEEAALQLAALESGGREQYLALLRQRAAKNLVAFHQKTGIAIPNDELSFTPYGD